MGKLGGRREGAGRPKGATNKLQADAKNQLIVKVLKKWNPIVETWIDLALGDYYIDEGLTNGQRKKIYKALPDEKSIKSLAEFVAGKPTQPIELEGEGADNLGKGMQDLGSAIREILTKKNSQ